MEQKLMVHSEIAKKLNESVGSVMGAKAMIGFEKAYLIAAAVGQLKELLTKEYMKPIMELQGNRLGFKTDKDVLQGGGKGPGYPEDIVKNCLIEAVLYGVQPFGNQFNIISNNCYITKEGMGYLLANFNGLSYDIVPQLPRIKEGSAAVLMDIEWTLNGVTKKKSIDIPVKVNSYMGADAVLGKATRKARAWLWNTLTGSEIPDGDTVDVEGKVVGSRINGEGESEVVLFEDLEMLYLNKKGVLNADDQASAERILTNKEEKSYGKLLKTLQSK